MTASSLESVLIPLEKSSFVHIIKKGVNGKILPLKLQKKNLQQTTFNYF